MDDAGLRRWLTLIRTPGIGNARLQQLRLITDDPADMQAYAIRHPDKLSLRPNALEWLSHPEQNLIDRDMDWIAQKNNHFLIAGIDDFPSLLLEIPDCPQYLFAKGDIDLMHSPQIAIVGSRNLTPQGKQNAHDFAAHLAASGITVTSGLALGVDSAAHTGALTQGATIAVTGTGLDRIYPARNKKLAYDIAEKGLLLSEFPLGTQPVPGNFPRRNRIISGLSIGTLVVEARINSGSLITARLALEQGREVFAIPSSIHNPQAKGCHQLIKQGCQLVENGNDIISQLGSLLGSYLEPIQINNGGKNSGTLDPEYELLLKNMGYDPISVDEIILRTQLPAASVSSMLLLLEMQSLVSSVAGGQYCRISTEEQMSE